jgi:serine protease DegQ
MGFLFLLLLQAPWADLVPTVQKSVPRLEMSRNGQQGVCSGVVFEIDPDGFALALTAAHCVERASDTERLDLTVNGRNGVVVATNTILDLAIVKFRARAEVPIVLARQAPVAGSELAIAGYAFGVEDIVVQFGRCSQSYNKETKSLWIDGMLIFGQSGGAIVNEKGELAGLTSRIYSGGAMGQMAHIGAAVPIESIKDFIDDFRERSKKR